MKFKHIIPATIIAMAAMLSGCGKTPSNEAQAGRSPVLYPELISGTVFPVNIAAPTFIINEEADHYFTEFTSESGQADFSVSSSSAAVKPSLKKWHKLLEESAGKEMRIKVAVENDGKWTRFDDLVCSVSTSPIDSILTYRLLYPGYELWDEIGIYQRDLSNYDQTAIIENKDIERHCVNCHSFAAGSPDNMMIHVRGKNGGTVIRSNGTTKKVNPKCPALQNGATYPAWHPSGKWIAYSNNDIRQLFHLSGQKPIEVYDRSADMTLYDVAKDEAVPIPGLNGEEWMETFPNWSPDGKTLFFTRSKTFDPKSQPDSIRYELCRISFDPETVSFGEPETLFDAPAVKKSVSFPKASPSGRWLLFTLSDYGNFSIWHPESDQWVMDLTDGSMRPLEEVNSDDIDSYHSWSSNGNWIVFSSKRLDGLWARPYIAYFDKETGRAGKPFVLPQSDPLFYDNFLKTFNIPELVRRPVEATDEFIRAVGY